MLLHIAIVRIVHSCPPGIVSACSLSSQLLIHPPGHKKRPRLRQVGGGRLSVSNRSSDRRAASTASLSLARYLENLRPSPANHPIHPPAHGRPALPLSHALLGRLLARTLARTCTSMYVPCTCTCTCTSHCRRFSCFIIAPFLTNLAFPALPCLALPRLPRLRSALSYDCIGPELAPSLPHPDRKTAHAFAWPFPGSNSYILARQLVLRSKYPPGPPSLALPLASCRIGAPSGPAHFPRYACCCCCSYLFEIALLPFCACPSTVDIGPRQHTGKLDR